MPSPPLVQDALFTFEPGSGVGCQPCGQPQADARGAASDQHCGFLHGHTVPAERALPFKRAGRGDPRPTPWLLCLLPYLKALPLHLPAP